MEQPAGIRPGDAGSVQFDLALVGGGRAGGLAGEETVTVLLCAPLTATPGPDARATLADLSCGPA